MKILGRIRTDKVGSEVTFEVDIHDADLEGLNVEESDAVIEEAVREAMWEHAEWGWETVS